MNPFQQLLSSPLQKPQDREMPCSLQLIAHEQEFASQEASQLKKSRRLAGSSSINNFIQKTFDILQEKKFESIVSWAQSSEPAIQSKSMIKIQPSGYPVRKNSNERVCSFKIHNVKAFEEIVLPQYFKHSNMSSFVRQLNMYSFHKVRGDKNQFEFEHERFIKNRPELLHEIKRKQIDSTVNIPSVSIISYPELLPLPEPQVQFSKEVEVQVEMMEVLNEMEEEKNISIQEIDSSQKEGEVSIARPSSNEEQLTYRLAQLQETNRNLKKTKQMKASALKQIALSNKFNIASKFNKIVMAIISSKLQQDIGQSEISNTEAKYNLNNLHTIVDHIMDSSDFKSFKEYNKMIYPLFESSEAKTDRSSS